jgi:hypothetical protein
VLVLDTNSYAGFEGGTNRVLLGLVGIERVESYEEEDAAAIVAQLEHWPNVSVLIEAKRGEKPKVRFFGKREFTELEIGLFLTAAVSATALKASLPVIFDFTLVETGHWYGVTSVVKVAAEIVEEDQVLHKVGEWIGEGWNSLWD